MMDKGGTSYEKEAPALVLFAGVQGETSVRVHVLTEDYGPLRGIVYGGASKAGRALWQPGNVVKVSFHKRSAASPLQISGELLYACAARLLDAPLALSMVQSVCVLADVTLPEAEPCPFLFAETVRLLTFLGYDPAVAEREGMPHVVRWEMALLATLGFGLDLSACAVTGSKENLYYASPRTGRAVSEEGAGEWKDRLLPLPSFLRDTDQTGTAQEWLEGLRLTGHFLARDAFGQRHLPLPAARQRLYDRLEKRILADQAPITE
ncbi:DNA recombination protein RecO [Acetobacter aceti 1023]|nr:DNA recombination protein RecO [Acetobacter aceti 1023]